MGAVGLAVAAQVQTLRLVLHQRGAQVLEAHRRDLDDPQVVAVASAAELVDDLAKLFVDAQATSAAQGATGAGRGLMKVHEIWREADTVPG